MIEKEKKRERKTGREKKWERKIEREEMGEKERENKISLDKDNHLFIMTRFREEPSLIQLKKTILFKLFA